MKSQLEVQQSELNLNRLVHFGRELDVITTSGDLLFGNGVSYLSEQIARQYSQMERAIDSLYEYYPKHKNNIVKMREGLKSFNSLLAEALSLSREQLMTKVDEWDLKINPIIHGYRNILVIAKKDHKDLLHALVSMASSRAQSLQWMWIIYSIVTFIIWFAFWSLIGSPISRLSHSAKDSLDGKLFTLMDRGPTEIVDVSRALYLLINNLEEQVRDRTAQVTSQAEALELEVEDRKEAHLRLEEVNVKLETALNDLETAQAKIIQEERLRALGQMAAGIAHDFNNALTPIMSYTEILIEMEAEDSGQTSAEALSAERLEMLKTISLAAQDGAHITQRLKSFSRPTQLGDFKSFELKAFLRSISRLSESRIRESNPPITLILFEPEEECFIMGDEVELRQAFLNLLFNAIDASSQGGEIHLKARHSQSEQDDTTYQISVQDFGEGMSPEVVEKCQEPFFTTKSDKGTGLGLAMVYGVVQSHGGTVLIDSQLGEGTSIQITLHQSSTPQKLLVSTNMISTVAMNH